MRRAGLVIGVVVVRPAARPRRGRHRPVDRRHLVQERRLRQRLLDPPRRPGRAVRRGRAGRARRPARQPARSRTGWCRRPIPTGPGRLRAVAGRLAEAQRQAERNARLRATGGPFGAFGVPGRPADGRRHDVHVRRRRDPGPRPDRHLGHRRVRRPPRARRRGRRVRGLGDGPAVGAPGPVLARRPPSPTRSSAGTSASSCSSCRSSASSSRSRTGCCSPRSPSPAPATCSP